MKCFVIAIMDKSIINLLFINLYHVINKFINKYFEYSENQKLNFLQKILIFKFKIIFSSYFYKNILLKKLCYINNLTIILKKKFYYFIFILFIQFIFQVKLVVFGCLLQLNKYK